MAFIGIGLKNVEEFFLDKSNFQGFFIAGSSNGRTVDSGSIREGSNPSPAAKHPACTEEELKQAEQKSTLSFGKLGGVGLLAVLFWKFKFVLVFILAK